MRRTCQSSRLGSTGARRSKCGALFTRPRASSAASSAPQRGGSRPALKLVVQDYKGKDNQVIQFEFDTGQELEEWAEAIVAAISRLSVIGLTQTDLTAEM